MFISIHFFCMKCYYFCLVFAVDERCLELSFLMSGSPNPKIVERGPSTCFFQISKQQQQQHQQQEQEQEEESPKRKPEGLNKNGRVIFFFYARKSAEAVRVSEVLDRPWSLGYV